MIVHQLKKLLKLLIAKLLKEKISLRKNYGYDENDEESS